MWWVPVLTVLCFDTLVGGNWANGSNAGLWALTVNETSSNANTGYGARLLIGNWDLMCLSARLSLSFALVGGRYDNGVNAGLWYWNVNNDSSLVNATVGARPLILGFGVFRTDSLLVS